MRPSIPTSVMAALVLALGINASATAQTTTTDMFGSGANTFTIDFVTVGNPGNGDNPGQPGRGSVPYAYRISSHEVTENDIEAAVAAGLTNVSAGRFEGVQPAGNVSWYEAAAFVNWLNTSKGYHAAYDLTFSDFEWSMTLWDSELQASTGEESGTNPYRHKDAYYFLPSADEWYKAAYHKNDGVTNNYYDYATASNTAPTPIASGVALGTAVYDQGFGGPASVYLAGGLSPYGTMGQNGNVWELTESADDGDNNVPSETRIVSGGSWTDPAFFLRFDVTTDPALGNPAADIGFRVASVPEPSAIFLVLIAVGAGFLMRSASRAH